MKQVDYTCVTARPTPTWGIRVANGDDRPFILDSWSKSTKEEVYAGNIPNHMVMAVLSVAVTQLMERGAKILVAHNPERESQIVGWLCAEQGRGTEIVMHAIYCKRPFRRMGIAKQLLARVGLLYTDPFPYTYRSRLSRVFPNARYMPSLQRRKSLK